MSVAFQHLLVLSLVIVCVIIIAVQGFRTLTLRGRGKLGSCCAKGCSAGENAETNSSAAHPQSDAGTRVQFLPVEMLSRRR